MENTYYPCLFYESHLSVLENKQAIKNSCHLRKSKNEYVSFICHLILVPQKCFLSDTLTQYYKILEMQMKVQFALFGFSVSVDNIGTRNKFFFSFINCSSNFSF